MTTSRPSEELHSCLYHGRVSHTRHQPFRHTFAYDMFLAYLDLAELDDVFSGHWLWSTGRANLAWFRRRDHFGDANDSLEQSVRQHVREQLDIETTGPIRLLTHLRYFGYVLNPVSFYYCFDDADTHVEAVVAEVTNTPWGETHCYAIAGTDHGSAPITAEHAKEFHVSPFMPMDMSYRWKIEQPGETLSVDIQSHRAGERVFNSTLSLKRRPITSGSLAAALCRHPLMTVRIWLAIYWQALRLWKRGATFHPHPEHTKRKPGRPMVVKPVKTLHELEIRETTAP